MATSKSASVGAEDAAQPKEQPAKPAGKRAAKAMAAEETGNPNLVTVCAQFDMEFFGENLPDDDVRKALRSGDALWYCVKDCAGYATYDGKVVCMLNDKLTYVLQTFSAEPACFGGLDPKEAISLKTSKFRIRSADGYRCPSGKLDVTLTVDKTCPLVKSSLTLSKDGTFKFKPPVTRGAAEELAEKHAQLLTDQALAKMAELPPAEPVRVAPEDVRLVRKVLPQFPKYLNATTFSNAGLKEKRMFESMAPGTQLGLCAAATTVYYVTSKKPIYDKPHWLIRFVYQGERCGWCGTEEKVFNMHLPKDMEIGENANTDVARLATYVRATVMYVIPQSHRKAKAVRPLVRVRLDLDEKDLIFPEV